MEKKNKLVLVSASLVALLTLGSVCLMSSSFSKVSGEGDVTPTQRHLTISVDNIVKDSIVYTADNHIDSFKVNTFSGNPITINATVASKSGYWTIDGKDFAYNEGNNTNVLLSNKDLSNKGKSTPFQNITSVVVTTTNKDLDIKLYQNETSSFDSRVEKTFKNSVGMGLFLYKDVTLKLKEGNTDTHEYFAIYDRDVASFKVRSINVFYNCDN